jgi:O-antigen/teichoic acid export membrane protein
MRGGAAGRLYCGLMQVTERPPDRPSGRFDPEGPGLRQRAARGTLVNAAFLAGLNSLSLVKGFVVAALLSTSEYGVWGILLTTLGTLLFFREAGIGDKYVQQDEPDQELAFQRAFSIELAFCGGLALLLAAAAPLLGAVYGQGELVAPALVLALMLPALALSAPIWIFYRRMEFVRQRSLQAIDPVVGFAVSVGLALAGAGYWSLLIGAVAGAWASAVAAVLNSPYRLRFRLDRATLRAYAGFSWPVIVSYLAVIAIMQTTMLVGEAELGLAGVGAIALASMVTMYTERIDEVVTATLYPGICAVRDRTELLFESFVKSNRLALMWGVPFGVGVALFAGDLVDFVLGGEWEPAVGLFQAVGLIAAANHVGFNWEAYYRARGETRPLAVVTVAVAVVFMACALPLLVSEGLDGLALGLAIMTAVGLVLRFAYVRRLFPGMRVLRHTARAIAPSVPAAGAVLLLRAVGDLDRSLGIALVELGLYVAVTVAATLAFERPLLREVVGYVRGRPAGAPA